VESAGHHRNACRLVFFDNPQDIFYKVLFARFGQPVKFQGLLKKRVCLTGVRIRVKRISAFRRKLGKRIGRIVTITDDLNEAAGTISKSEGSDLGSMLSDFVASAPDQIEVQKVVSVTYEIW